MFDFGGAYIGGDDEDDEPNKPRRSKGGGSDDGAGASGAGLWAAGSGGRGMSGIGGVPGYGDGDYAPPDRSCALVGAAVDLLSVEVDVLAERLVPRLAQYLEAFTEGRYAAAVMGPRGEIALCPPDGDPVPYPDLPADVGDVVDVALRFALAESVLRRYRFPILIDDPFCDLGPRRRHLFGQMLAYFAQGTQLVVATSQEDLPGNRL